MLLYTTLMQDEMSKLMCTLTIIVLLNAYVFYTPVTPNTFLLRSSERARAVCKLTEHSTNVLNVVQTY